ncbi:MAG: Sec-dependent nitrous-oxide reductase [Candidatus Melainabacteria bacterium]|nr:Sec-dependent nitrous-oxide reductase [Candidatus Melainabacteria bacterium]
MKGTRHGQWCCVLVVLLAVSLTACSPRQQGLVGNANANAAEKVYVAPGKYDKYYAFLSGGYNGQVSVYGLPSGRLFKIIPVFSVDPDSGYGYSEETKSLLMTSYGFLPWDDSHHPQLSMSNGTPDGRWLFINGNNTPRIARIDLRTFETVETLELPNSAGNHASPFTSMNSEYVASATRFSIPVPNQDVPISSYKKNMKGILSFVKVDPKTGQMNLAFQVLVPGFNYDICHFGKGPSKDWCFFSCYNSEQANTLLEVNASQFDKDFTLAINWKRAEAYASSGKGKLMPAVYFHNMMNQARIASSTKLDKAMVLASDQCPDMMYYIPTPKSPHGLNVDPSGEYMVAGGKLAATVPVFSFAKMLQAIDSKAFETTVAAIPVLRYEAVLKGEVQNPCLGPLHDEFDDKGFAYTTGFISSNIAKWNLATRQVVDTIATYYSPGHLMIPGGDTMKPSGQYCVALNKITKDRYLPTGPELCHSAQLIDISGERMKLLLDFPTVGEPHYAQAIASDKIMGNSLKIFDLSSNGNPFAIKDASDAKVVRQGKDVHVYMGCIRSRFLPDNIEGIKVGDAVYFHVTSLEQDWGIGHGFALQGAQVPNVRVMSGETRTVVWKPQKPGIYPFYCTDFCSALHQEMQGYVRVSPSGSNVPLCWAGGGDSNCK